MKIETIIFFIVLGLAQNLASQQVNSYQQRFLFSGMSWKIKVHHEKMGPGNNLFGIHKKNVDIDKQNRLRLAIKKVKNEWSSAEIVSEEIVNEGSFEFVIESDLSKIKTNVVFGIFLYNDINPPFYDEIDIEFSKWGNKTGSNSQYVIHQKGELPKRRFTIPEDSKPSFHRINITKDSIIFSSRWHLKSKNANQFAEIRQAFPRPASFKLNSMHIRLNLWLYKQNNMFKRYPPILISKIKYTPYKAI